MRNIGLLIKNYFKGFIGSFSKNGKLKKKLISASGLILLMSALFIFIFTNLAIGTVQTAITTGYPTFALYANASMALVFILLMTFTRSTAPTKSNDDELLLSLPIKKVDIIIAKVFFDFLFDFAIVLIILLPAYIVYYVLVPGASFFIIIRGALIIILLPMFSSAIGSFIGAFFARIASRFKYYSIIQSIFSIIMILVFLVCYYGISFLSTTENAEAANILLNLAPLQWIVNFVGNNDLISLLIILAIVMPVFALSVWLKTFLLGRSMSKYRSNKTSLNFKPHNVFQTLFRREASRYFSIPIYVVNTIFGSLMLLVLGVIIATLGGSYLDSLLSTFPDFAFLKNYYAIIVLLIMGFSASTICITSSSISLEGNTLWILKAHPVNTKAILLSKVIFNLVMGIVPIVICAILCAINVGFIYLPFMIIIPSFICLLVAIWGLYFNLIYYRFDWESEVVPVKQGISVLLAMVAGMIITLVPFGLFLFIGKWVDQITFMFILIGIYIILTLLSYLLLTKNGKKRFEHLTN